MSNKKISMQKEIGERLRAYRKKNKLNGNDFAILCGVSQGALSGIENGKSYPSAETIISLLKNTDIDLKWLLTGSRKEEKARMTFIQEIEEWLNSEIKIDNRIETWFQVQFEELFPKFKAWKERKEGKIEGGEIAPISKVA